MSLKIAVIERGSSSRGAHSFMKRLSCPLRQASQEEPSAAIQVGLLVHAALEHCHSMTVKDLRCATFEGDWSPTHATEALRLVRAYLGAERYHTVEEVEVPVEGDAGGYTISGRFDAVVSVNAEQAMQASQSAHMNGMLLPGRWVLDYKTCYSMERFSPAEYFWGPQGRFYEYLGGEYRGMLFAALSRDHPAQVQFHACPFECDPAALKDTISRFVNMAQLMGSSWQTAQGRDLRDCYKYGKLCPRAKDCFGLKESEDAINE